MHENTSVFLFENKTYSFKVGHTSVFSFIPLLDIKLRLKKTFFFQTGTKSVTLDFFCVIFSMFK